MNKAVLIFAVTMAWMAVSGADMEKEWTRNGWDGYKPFASHEFTDGALHIYNAESKYGFGWRSIKHFDAVAGDEAVITARVKGKGEVAFQLQYFTADGHQWTGIDPKSVEAALENEWKEKTFRLRVGNLKKGITGRIMPTFSGKKGTELYIKDIVVKVVRGEFSGDLMFPRHWTVFGDVDGTLEPSLTAIPAEVGGVKGRKATLNDGIILLKSFFAKRQIRNCAWLYAEIEAPYACDYTLGAGADYFMALYVNGVKAIDTIQSGNGKEPPHFSDHTVNVKLAQGKNIIAVKFLSGGSAEPYISLGGANELRNLSSVVKVTSFFEQDDFEKPGKRSGNPNLIEGILTDGIETKCGFGVYSPGSGIVFDGKTYSLPPKSGDLFFATGIRLQKLSGKGTMTFDLGGKAALTLKNDPSSAEIEATMTCGGKTLKSMEFPKSALPTDIVLAVSCHEFYINLLSIQDSKLRAISGKADFSGLGNFVSDIRLHGCEATVDNYFTGLARREVKSSTVPFKVALDPAFDPVKAGWKLVWKDEFNGERVDWENTWMNSPWSPAPKNREMAYLKDGMLHIRCEFKKTPDGKSPYTGETVGLFSQKRFSYGYYEARVRFTKKPGWWAAFWMLDEGRNMAVGGGYELDIFEDYSTRGGTPVIANNLHVTYGPNMRSYGYHLELPGSLDDFYVIGCKWTPFEISHYINGKLVRTEARHSPYTSATYDAVNHGFGTSTLYVCLSGQAGSSGGRADGEYSEEYLVDYVRAYEYPRETAPRIGFTAVPKKSVLKTGEPFEFTVGVTPSDVSKFPVTAVYLFDNGNLLDYKTKPPFRFQLAIDRKHYENTVWDMAGRSGKRPVMDGYPHFYVAAVQDEAGNVAYTEPFPMIADMTGGEPFQGKIQMVPGILPAGNYNVGGQNVACYKQARGGLENGKENLFNRKALNLREAGEWVNYTVDVKQGGTYKVVLRRQKYRREWSVRGMLLVDGRYIGDLKGDPKAESVVLEKVELKSGKQLVTLISACTYGVWPESIEFIKE